MTTLYTAGNAQNGYQSNPLETRTKLLWWQEQGLQYTASGYGRKIPTRYQVKDGNRWKRVYCCIYSNIGTCYFLRGKEWITLSDVTDID